MNHRLSIERLFSLGDYKNIKIIAETSDISDEDWSNPEVIAVLRKELVSEIYINFALSQFVMGNLQDDMINNEWEEIMKTMLEKRKELKIKNNE